MENPENPLDEPPGPLQISQVHYPFNCISPHTYLRSSHGSESIASAIKYNSSALNLALVEFDNSLNRVVFIPVFLDTSALLIDFFAKNSPSLVIYTVFRTNYSLNINNSLKIRNTVIYIFLNSV